jgi:hypothetical protein
MNACKWVVEGPAAIAFQVFQSIMASKPNDIFKSRGKSLAKREEERMSVPWRLTKPLVTHPQKFDFSSSSRFSKKVNSDSGFSSGNQTWFQFSFGKLGWN